MHIYLCICINIDLYICIHIYLYMYVCNQILYRYILKLIIAAALLEEPCGGVRAGLPLPHTTYYFILLI